VYNVPFPGLCLRYRYLGRRLIRIAALWLLYLAWIPLHRLPRRVFMTTSPIMPHFTLDRRPLLLRLQSQVTLFLSRAPSQFQAPIYHIMNILVPHRRLRVHNISPLDLRIWYRARRLIFTVALWLLYLPWIPFCPLPRLVCKPNCTVMTVMTRFSLDRRQMVLRLDSRATIFLNKAHHQRNRRHHKGDAATENASARMIPRTRKRPKDFEIEGKKTSIAKRNSINYSSLGARARCRRKIASL
jgi:hypothetical protein